MGIPQTLVDELMVKCGRCCCICRRFKPLHLQVHHIVERSDGGDDDPDNLIAICLTCHSDVHTHTAFTRRFTVGELKMQRDEVFRLVGNGTLTEGDDDTDEFEELIAEVVSRLVGPADEEGVSPTISAEALEQLLRVAQAGGTMLDMSQYITYDSDIREISRVKAALDELEQCGLMAWIRDSRYRVTHQGFLLADQVLAAGSSLWGQDEDSRRVREQLQARQSFEFDGIALADAIQYISNVAGVNIHTKWAFLNAAGVDRDSEVSIGLVEVTVEKALRVILEDVSGASPLGFCVDHGVITISTRSDLDHS